MSNREGRINNEHDLEYLERNHEIAYYEKGRVYYDPSYKLYYRPIGEIYDPRRDYNHMWFENAEFLFSNGNRCWLPEQLTSTRKEDEKKASGHPKRSSSGLVNFLVIGMMATCEKTNAMENRVSASWEEQRSCSFAIKSIENPRCMFWSPNLDGHCSCYEAYDDKVRGNSSLDRIDSIKKKDIEREREDKSKDPEHHFKEADEINLSDLSDLFSNGKLTKLREGSDSYATVFYYDKWDVFFDGHGKFLKTMTKQRRNNKQDPETIVRNWDGPLAMTVGVPLIGVDNSGTIDPIQMHEFLHELDKIKKSPAPIMWEVDDDEEDPLEKYRNCGQGSSEQMQKLAYHIRKLAPPLIRSNKKPLDF